MHPPGVARKGASSPRVRTSPFQLELVAAAASFRRNGENGRMKPSFALRFHGFARQYAEVKPLRPTLWYNRPLRTSRSTDPSNARKYAQPHQLLPLRTRKPFRKVEVFR